ncbi:MAG: glycoside hydrolase domain-containing protein [Promethearchaeota archaeon]
MFYGEGNTHFLAMNIMIIGMTFGFIIIHFIDKKYFMMVMQISESISFILLIIMLFSFTSFAKELLEPWIMQSGWFLRYNGILNGLFLATTAVKVIFGFSTLTLITNGRKELEINSPVTKKRSGINQLMLLILVIFSVVSVLLFLIFRYESLAEVLLLLITITSVGLIISMTRFNQHAEFLLERREIFRTNTIISNNNKMVTRDNFDISMGDLARSSYKTSFSRTRYFWTLAIFLLVLSSFTIAGIVTYPLNIEFNLYYTFGKNYNHLRISLNTILSLIPAIFLLIITPMIILIQKSASDVGFNMDKTLSKGTKAFLKGFFNALSFLFVMFIISQLIYYHDYPIFLPETVAGTMMFSIFGFACAFFASKKPHFRQVLVLLAFIILLIEVMLIYNDYIHEAFNLYGVDPIFVPKDQLASFWYSWQNLATVGIAIGIIIEDLLLDLIRNNSNRQVSSGRALLVVIMFFFIGALSIPSSYINDNPGGDIGHDAILDPSSFENSIFFYFAMVNMIFLCFNILVYTFSRVLKHENRLGPRAREIITIKSRDVYKIPRQLKKNKYKLIGSTIAIIALFSGMISTTIGISSGNAIFYKKPFIEYSPGNYLVWFQDSTERINKKARIFPDNNYKVDSYTMNLAKNEYGAFQIAWRTFNKEIFNVHAEISDFTIQDKLKNDIIPSNSCSIRLVSRVIQDEFPDLLMPVTIVKSLNPDSNNVFWFSLKTPYNISSGDYLGNVSFTYNDQGEIIVPIHVHVWNFSVPHTKHLRANIGGQSSDYRIIDNYLFHRFNDYGTWISASLNKNTNNWTFYWNSFDEITQYKLDHGMNAFMVPYRPFGGRDPDIQNEALIEQLINWLKGVEAHLIEKNWTKYAYIYFIDEFNMFVPEAYTREEYFSRLQTLLAIMKNASPSLRIMTTTPPSDELGNIRSYIDIYCPISYDRDKDRWESMMRENKEFWFYPCVIPFAPWPNSHLYNRLYECRILSWQTFLYKVQGFLYWSSRAYYHGRYGMGYNGWGDGWFIYVTDDEVLDSIRWENYLDGQEDYEYAWLLNESLNILKNSSLLDQETVLSMQQEFNDTIRRVTGETWRYTDSAKTLIENRNKIGEMLDNISYFLNLNQIGEAPWSWIR